MSTLNKSIRLLHLLVIVSLASGILGLPIAAPITVQADPPRPVSPEIPVTPTETPPPPAPASPHTIRLQSRQFRPTTPDVDALNRLTDTKRERVHILVQLDFIPRRLAKAALAAQGLHLLAYVPDYAWIASVPASEPDKVLTLPGVVWAGPLTVDDKLAPAIRADRWDEFNLAPDGTAAVYISLHQDENLDTGRKLAESYGGKVVNRIVGINTLVVEMPRANIRALAAEDAVQWIEPVGPPLTENNDGIRAQIGVDTVQATPYSLDGSGVDVLVYDAGQVGDHPDFGSRLTHGDSTAVSDHSTHVAGTLGGDGTQSTSAGGSDRQWRGVAPNVDIISYGFEWDGSGMWFYDNPGDIEHDWAQAQNSNGADIGTASIGSNISFYFPGSCDLLGNYGETARLMDQIVRGGNSTVGIGDKYIATWSVGNERGGIYCATTPAGYRKIAPPAAAKNPIHVGASNTDNDSMTTFSSWGPTDDGRIKPLVVAGGDQVGGDGGINSTIPDLFINNTTRDCDGSGDDYCYPYDVMAGTSMATPAVAGGIALMLQHYWDVYNTYSPFWPSTAKVILMQTAEDMGRLGPDYQWGYGQVNIQAAVDLISRKAFLEDSVDDDEVDVFYFVVPDDDEPVTVSLAWDDYEATVNADPALINDLDLELVAPDGTVWRPWVLDPNNPTANATRGVDDINNQEQVQVFAANEDLIGTWIVRVKGTTVPQGPQDYSLACEGCQPLDLEECQSRVSGSTFSMEQMGPEPTLTAGEMWQRQLEASLLSAEKDIRQQEEQEISEAVAQVEAAWEEGPEAVVALIRTLTGPARDLLEDELALAEEKIHENAPPMPARPPVSEEEEQADAETAAETFAANRALALADRTDPAENGRAAIPVRTTAAPNRPAADLTVGQGCTYATIGEALSAASPGDRILVEGGATFTENLTINITLTLQGGYTGCVSGSSDNTTVDGGGTDSVLIIARGISVTLRNLNITNGSCDVEGGGIQFATGVSDVNSTLTLDNVEIHNNHSRWGGGLWVGPGAQVVGTYVEIHDNEADAKGGGVRLFGSQAEFTNSNVNNNTSPLGGGVYASKENGHAPSLELPSSADIYENEALTGDGLGGGLYMSEGTVSLADCSDFYDNNAVKGGGTYILTTTLYVSGGCSEIEYNSASDDGGGIYAQDSTIYLTEDVELRNNSANGSGGGAYLDFSYIFGDKSIIKYNTAQGKGGGVCAVNSSYVDMDLGGFTCINEECSAISSNTANSYGGGIYLNSSAAELDNTYVEENSGFYGGGVYVYDSSIWLYNVLFAGNDSTAGVGDGTRLYHSSSLSGSGDTWAYNDAGSADTGRAIDLASYSSLDLSCSIVWGHTTSINPTGEDVTYSDVQGGYDGAGNINADPLFVGGGDYHLQSNSPAIDRCISGPDTDLDGESRPIVRNTGASPYDMGADEMSGTASVGINGGSCAYATIQQAINAAEDGDTLYIASGVYFENVIIDNKDLTIVGGYDSTCTNPASPGETSRIEGSLSGGNTFKIREATVTLRNLDIAWGDGFYGGGLYVTPFSKVTLDNVDIHDNHGFYGGGIYIASDSVVTATGHTNIIENVAIDASGGGGGRVWGTLVGTDLSIEENCAPHGGGLYVPGGQVYLTNASISQNEAAHSNSKGGGLYITSNGVFSATNSYFTSNSAYNGGGIYADSGIVRLNQGSFGLNSADDCGGGLYLTDSSDLYMKDISVGYSTFFIIPLYYPNTAQTGGGIYADDSTLTIEGGHFSTNRATFYGGGLYLQDSELQMTGTVVGHWGNTPGNRISNSGLAAGIYFYGSRGLISDTTVISNVMDSSGSGGGIYIDIGSAVTLTNSTVRGHSFSAPNGFGGGIYVWRGTLTLDHSQVLSNTATAYGGGIRLYDGATLNTTNDSSIMYNHADMDGGGIAATDNTNINISDTTLQYNSSDDDGGAVYLSDSNAYFTGWWDVRWNDAHDDGGGVAAIGSSDVDFLASDSTRTSYLSVNHAHNGDGGGLYVNSDDTLVLLYAFYGSPLSVNTNTAADNGGAIAIESNTALVAAGDVQMTSNSAITNGGAIYLSNSADVGLFSMYGYEPEILVNTAQNGGAIYATNDSNIFCSGVTFGHTSNGNQATSGDGGAIHLREGVMNIVDTLIRNNQASSGYGGGIYVYSSTVEIDRSILHDNAAVRGGAIYQYGDNTVTQIQNTLIHDNSSSAAYGAGIRANKGVLTMTHDTLADNTGGAGLSAYFLSALGLHDTIFWDNDQGIVIYGVSTAISHTCNIDQGGLYGLNQNPRFIASGSGDYHLRGDSPARDRCAVGLDYDLDDVSRPIGEGYDAGAYEYPYDIVFVPDNNGTGLPSSVITYTHFLTNSGGITDTYVLSSTSAHGWTVTTSPSALTLGAGQTATVFAFINLPAGVLSGTVDTALITATSTSDSYLKTTVTDTTTIGLAPGANFEPDYTTVNATPGNTYNYTHTLTNAGNYTDTFNLAFDSSQGWGTLLDSGPFTLGPGDSETVHVRVVVPSSGGGLSDNSVVTATSTGGATATVLDITSAFQPGLAFESDENRTVTHDTTVTYTHRLTNTGNAADTFHLTLVSSRGWGSLLDAGPFTLNPGAATDVRVRVVVPFGAGGLSDTTIVTATSTGGAGPEAVGDTTTVYAAGLSFAPSYSQDVPAGDTVTYTHHLTNTGAAEDTFDVALVSSSQGWATLVDSGPFTLNPGAATTVRVRVVVPSASGGLDEVTVITASSRAGSLSHVTAIVTDTSHSIRSYGAALTPAYDRSVAPGTVLTHTHRLTNTGNSTDTFTLHLSSSAGWGTLVDGGPFTLTAGSGTAVRVRVTVPDGVGGSEDVSTLVATSQLSPTHTARTTDTTHAIYTPTVVLTPSFTADATAGAVVVYTHYLTNTGNGPDQFALTLVSERGWSTLLDPGPFNLNAGQKDTVRVQVSVPAGSGGLTETAILTATAQNGGVSASVTDVTRVPLAAGVDLSPDYTVSAPPGETPRFTHFLQNTGNGADTFDISISSSHGWASLTTSSTVALDSGAMAQVEVTVQVPEMVISGTQTNVTVITATSRFDPSVYDTAYNTTTVGFAPGVSLAPDRTTTGATVGNTYDYTHTLTNLGNYTDTFTLTFSTSQGWGSLLTLSPIVLGPWKSTTVQVQVTVPAGGSGQFDTSVVTATSQGGAGPAVVHDTTAAFNPGVVFEQDNSQTVNPGEAVTYTHLLTNTGDAQDTIVLSLDSSQGWATLLDSGPFVLAAGASTTVRVRVTAPTGSGGLHDTTIITAATLNGNGPTDSVTDETSSTFTPGVALGPDYSQSVAPGSAVIYTHRITNTGNGPDVFSVTLSSSQGWGTLLDSGPFTLTSGSSAQVRVQVAVPPNTTAQMEDITTITARNSAGTVSDTATDRTTVACVSLAGVSFTAPPTATVGQSVTFSGSVASGNPPITYTWNFGDGSAVQNGNPIAHTFASTGTFTVLMTTTNLCSGPLTATKSIKIVPPGVQPPRKIYLPLVLRNH